MNGLLYGHHPEERIVAVQQRDDATMRLYLRTPGGELARRDERFYPFFYLADSRLLEGFRPKHWLRQLQGHGYYRYLCAFEEWSVMWDALRRVLDAYNASAVTKVDSVTDLDAVYFPSDPVAQFLLQSGRTLFKGMAFEDLHRLQVDIETYATPPHRFSNPVREGDRIILIALADSRGMRQVIDGRKMDERTMLLEFARLVRETDPDVIEGHNIFNFDLPYLLTRANLHGITLGLGRDGSPPRSFDARTSFADHPFDFTAAEIAGRHIIDTLLLVQSYDAIKRTMESYGLKYAARFFGLAPEGRTYIDGDRISWHWDHDPQPLIDYALDDVEETRRLSEHLSQSSFYLTQMVPGSYGVVSRSGAAGKIEGLLVREYLRRRESLPRPQDGTQTTGGYTDVFLTGAVGPVVHADVESLYPSIMLTRKISPASDSAGVFLDLLRELTSRRLQAKQAMRSATDPVERSRLDALQSSLKILINSFYGYLGYARALFNDFRQADEVTRIGQQLLREMIQHIQGHGGRVIEVDTDGLFFVPPPEVDGEAAEAAYVSTLSSGMPGGITVAMNGRYRRMLSYKKKNYALQEYDGTVRIKGSSLISRSMEPFGRTYVRACIEALLKGDVRTLHDQYVHYHRALTEHKLEVAQFARTETLKDPPARYLEEVQAGKRNKSAPYEVALSLGRQLRAGDRITYYITGADLNVRGFEHARAATEWNPHFPDENTPYYLRRLDEFSEKFVDFFHPQDFRAIFSTEGLFPFDPTGIEPVVAAVTQPEENDRDEITPQKSTREEE